MSLWSRSMSAIGTRNAIEHDAEHQARGVLHVHGDDGAEQDRGQRLDGG